MKNEDLTPFTPRNWTPIDEVWLNPENSEVTENKIVD